MVKALKFKDMWKVNHNNIRSFEAKSSSEISEGVVKKWFMERQKVAYQLMKLHHTHPMVYWLQSLDHRFIMTTAVSCRLGVCHDALCNGEDWLVYKTIAKNLRCSNDKGKAIVAEGVERGELMYIEPPSNETTRGACFTATDKIIEHSTTTLSKWFMERQKVAYQLEEIIL